jgi:hypothetical protein
MFPISAIASVGAWRAFCFNFSFTSRARSRAVSISIAIPSSEQLDDIIIAAAAEKCHGATGAARSRSDGVGIDARRGLKDSGSVAKLPGHIVGSKVDAFVVTVVRR